MLFSVDLLLVHVFKLPCTRFSSGSVDVKVKVDFLCLRAIIRLVWKKYRVTSIVIGFCYIND